jgi:hypothetical protein
MAITKSNIYTEGYRIVKDFLNNNLSDPRKRFKKSWIHASTPDVTSKVFEGYPFLTCKLNVSQQNNSLDIVTAEDLFKIQVIVYSDESTDVDNLSSELFSKINNKTLTYNLNELKAKVLSSSDIVTTMVNSKKIYSRVFQITAKIRMANA